MKIKRSPLLFLPLFLVGIFAFQKSSTHETSLQDALNAGLVTCTYISNGKHSGESVNFTCKNKQSAEMKLKIPKGTLFYPANEDEQTLITIEDQFVLLAPNEKHVQGIKAFCSESGDHSPSANSSFKLGKNRNPKFDSLFQYIDSKKIPDNQQQWVVWSISDNSPVSNISADTKTMRDLRSFLFKLTKQEEVSYYVQQSSSVDANGLIQHKPVQIHGFLTFRSDKNKWIHQEVYDENGKLKFKSEQAFQIPNGSSDYSFSINVGNWKPGNYVLKLKNGSEEVENYSFKI